MRRRLALLGTSRGVSSGMTRIWKYELPIEDVATKVMPAGAEILHVGLDPSGQPCVWALVQENEKMERSNFHIVGTGNPMSDEITHAMHLGSIVQGPSVWHVFDGGWG